MKTKFINRNPWQRTIPDCTIRAFSLALRLSYEETCKRMRVKCIPGFGMYNGEDNGAGTIKEMLAAFKKEIRSYYMDPIYKKWAASKKDDGTMKGDPFINAEEGLDIEETIALLPKGRYIFFIRPSEKERKRGDLDWHAVFVKKPSASSESIMYDTYKREDLFGRVYGYIEIDPKAVKSNDNAWLSEMIKLYYRGENWGDFVPPILTKKEFEIFKERLRTKKDPKQRKWFFDYMKKHQFSADMESMAE